MDLYLVYKNNQVVLLIDPSESDMENAEVLGRRLNACSLFFDGLPLINMALQKITALAGTKELFFEKACEFKRLADIFELYVPGSLMATWQLTRATTLSELTLIDSPVYL